MARQYKNEAPIRQLIDNLCRLYSGYQSLSKLSQLLIDATPEHEISFHPNRIKSFLNGDENQSINDRTALAFLQTVEKLDIASLEDVVFQEIQKKRFLDAKDLNNGDEKIALAEMNSEAHPLEIYRRYLEPRQSAQLSTEKRTKDDSKKWAWQAGAIDQTSFAMENNPGKNIGLVIPTGGGKTTIAVKILCRRLLAKPEEQVLWFAHRRFLLAQAEDNLRQYLASLEKGIRGDITNRIHFLPMNDRHSFTDAVKNHPTAKISVVDEAHRAGAPIYQDLIASDQITGLLLTATPVRTDNRPIGMDLIGFQTGYKELIEGGCILEPQFEKYESTHADGVFDTRQSLEEFADKILDDLAYRFEKSLVCVSRQANCEELYQIVLERLKLRLSHPLQPNAIAFAHGEKYQPNEIRDRDEFLQWFKRIDVGLLIATTNLISEGFDDPKIDSVYVTYAANSVLQLMQIAGRALRYQPDKLNASIIQVREKALQYYFNSQWLYQDISDRLRPAISRVGYEQNALSSFDSWLRTKNINVKNLDMVRAQISQASINGQFRVFFIGLAYYGREDEFDLNAEWFGVVLSGNQEAKFVDRYNTISASDRINDPDSYTVGILGVTKNDPDFPVLCDIIHATNEARREILDDTWSEYRGRTNDLSSTWLLNLSFYTISRTAPYDEFLSDCTNAKEIRQLIKLEDKLPSLVKIAHPLVAYEAFMLSKTDFNWLQKYLFQLKQEIEAIEPEKGWRTIGQFRDSLPFCPVPQRLIIHATQLLNKIQYDYQVWHT